MGVSITTLEHSGVKGMKWGIRRTKEQLGHVAKKAEKVITEKVKSKVLAVRTDNNRAYAKGLKKMSKMTPEETDKFMSALKKQSEVEKINKERLENIAGASMASAKIQQQRLATIDAGLKVTGTAVSVFKKVTAKDAGDTMYQDLAKGLASATKPKTQQGKDNKARENYQLKNAKGTNVSRKQIDDISVKYSKVTGTSLEKAKAQVTKISKLQKKGSEFVKTASKMLAEQEKQTNKEKKKKKDVEHSGVKGMRWGVRNEKRNEGTDTVGKRKDARTGRPAAHATTSTDGDAKPNRHVLKY